MVNLSRINLNQSEIDLLEKGLNFIPAPKTVMKEPILESANQFGRRLKLAYYYRKSKSHFKQNFVPKSTWVPPKKDIPKVIFDTIKNIESDISLNDLISLR